MTKRPTVLVLNGSEDLLDVLAELLLAEGLHPVCVRIPDVERGKTDLGRLVQEHEPVLLVFDVSVPFGRSWATLLEVAAHPSLVGLPRVLTTTNRAGALPYTGPEVIELLLKPYDIDQFLRAVNRALHRSTQGHNAEGALADGNDGSSNLSQ
jgi:DNA-binding NtrC family response regulator